MLNIKKISRTANGLLLLLALACAAKAQTTKTVRFPKGSNAATVGGKIVRGRAVIYLVRARKNQILEFHIAGGAASSDVVAEVFAPGGKTLTGEDYGKEWRGILPYDGVYKISVGTIESENAAFKMRITIR